MSKRYTEGIASDGAAILDNGKPITITEILKRLNKLDKLENKSNKPTVIKDICNSCGRKMLIDYVGIYCGTCDVVVK